ncbi:MipA/OmpV family protein [Rhizorhabdus wittichii]
MIKLRKAGYQPFGSHRAGFVVVISSLALGLAAIPGKASAQSAEKAPWQADHITIGAGATVIPTFEGSDSTRVMPLPAIDIRQGIFIANLLNGVGVDVPVSDSVSLGAGAVFVLGYRHKDVPDGIDKISNAAGIRGHATIRKWGFIGSLGVTKILGGTKGTTADVLVSYPIRLDDRLTVAPALGTSWADSKYNDRYFGISEAEAMRSGLPTFHMGSGFKDVVFSLNANYRLSPRWNLTAGASAIRLVGDALDSPLVQKKLNGTGLVTLSYTFGR